MNNNINNDNNKIKVIYKNTNLLQIKGFSAAHHKIWKFSMLSGIIDGWVLDGWVLDGWVWYRWVWYGWVLDGWVLDGGCWMSEFGASGFEMRKSGMQRCEMGEFGKGR